jgi:hypothetical protein
VTIFIFKIIKSYTYPKYCCGGSILATRIHRNLFSTISKLKISKLSLFTRRDLTPKIAFLYLGAFVHAQEWRSTSSEGLGGQGTGATEVLRGRGRSSGGAVGGEQGSEEHVREREGAQGGREEGSPDAFIERERRGGGESGRETATDHQNAIDGHQWSFIMGRKKGKQREEKGRQFLVWRGRTDAAGGADGSGSARTVRRRGRPGRAVRERPGGGQRMRREGAAGGARPSVRGGEGARGRLPSWALMGQNGR